jgi:membrane-bound metal-dependent hydrolase YbcI (DUF457 family)
MPNFKKHITVGAAVGGGANLAWQVAALPDIIEPATNNLRHRAVFHSLACAGCVTYGAFGKHIKNLPPKNRHAVQVAAVSYLSHLLLDGNTPDGLPVAGLTRIKI